MENGNDNTAQPDTASKVPGVDKEPDIIKVHHNLHLDHLDETTPDIITYDQLKNPLRPDTTVQPAHLASGDNIIPGGTRCEDNRRWLVVGDVEGGPDDRRQLEVAGVGDGGIEHNLPLVNISMCGHSVTSDLLHNVLTVLMTGGKGGGGGEGEMIIGTYKRLKESCVTNTTQTTQETLISTHVFWTTGDASQTIPGIPGEVGLPEPAEAETPEIPGRPNPTRDICLMDPVFTTRQVLCGNIPTNIPSNNPTNFNLIPGVGVSHQPKRPKECSKGGKLSDTRDGVGLGLASPRKQSRMCQKTLSEWTVRRSLSEDRAMGIGQSLELQMRSA